MPQPQCSATKADGEVCGKKGKQDGLCGTHHRQRQRLNELEAVADAREIPEDQVRPENRCTKRLLDHSRCTREAVLDLNGLCTMCHRIIENNKRTAPYRKLRSTLVRMIRDDPRRLAPLNTVIDEAEANGMEAGYIQWLRRYVRDRWEARYYNTIDEIFWNDLGEQRELYVVAANGIIDMMVREMSTIEPLTDHFVARLRQYVNHLQHRRQALDEFHRRLTPERELERLAADRQNVHTTAVSKQMTAGLAILVAADPGPPPKGEDSTVKKIVSAFASVLDEDPSSVNILAIKRDLTSMWKRSQESRTAANPINYHKALRGLWAKINSYTGDTHKELIQRLWEECLESVDMCTMGHLARLTNVMVGYEEEFKQEEPIGEKIQRRMAEIAGMDVEYDEQIRLATEFLEEHEVEAEKQREWLSAF